MGLRSFIPMRELLGYDISQFVGYPPGGYGFYLITIAPLVVASLSLAVGYLPHLLFVFVVVDSYTTVCCNFGVFS